MANDPAPPLLARAGVARFDAPQADFDAMQRAAVYALRDDVGVIEARGPDAVTFLQSQLTNDVSQLGPEGMQLNGYCTAKGRLLAVFTAWRDTDAVYLQLPSEILPAVLRRLSMFVLRAKVKLADVSTQWACGCVFGAGSSSALNTLGLTTGLEPWQAASEGGVRIWRLADAPRAGARYLVVAPAQQSPPLATLPRVGTDAWWWTQVDAAIPEVFAATQEAFVPQMINLEVLGGVSFRKGCYPGQEVVARSQYLGKLRRRMSIGHTTARVEIGGDVNDGDGTAIGKVALAAAAPGGGTDLLFECPVDRLGASLTAGSECTEIRVLELPYELHDVTA